MAAVFGGGGGGALFIYFREFQAGKDWNISFRLSKSLWYEPIYPGLHTHEDQPCVEMQNWPAAAWGFGQVFPIAKVPLENRWKSLFHKSGACLYQIKISTVKPV